MILEKNFKKVILNLRLYNSHFQNQTFQKMELRVIYAFQISTIPLKAPDKINIMEVDWDQAKEYQKSLP